jgi:6,7-dimethyl-8-ribityllumazine synthase
MTEFRGRRDGSERRFCIVVSQFNVMVTDRLLEGARDELRENGVASDDIDVIHVPGAWELTSGVRSAVRRDYSGVLALGCVVRGETAHFDYICSSVTQGLTHKIWLRLSNGQEEAWATWAARPPWPRWR